MPQVPYDPTPNVRPSGQGISPLNVGQVSGAAFGTNVATAEEGFGKELGHAADTLASDILNAQGLKNEADVNQATTDYLMKSGELDNNFRLLQGDQPQAKLQEHVQAMRDLRESARDSLGNPMAQKMFDRETMRRFGYDVVNASNYASTQMKGFTNQSYEANQLSMADRAAKDPYNTQYLHQVIQSTIDSEAKLSADNGDPPELTKMKIEGKVGRAIGGVATALGKNNPDQAMKFLDEFKDKMSAADYIKNKEILLDRSVQYHSSIDARNATSGGLLDRARAATKTQESGGNYQNITTTISKKTGQPQSALGAYGIMEVNVGPWSEEALGYKVTKAEFLSNPDLQDKIYDFKMQQYINKYGIEGAGQAWIGGEGGVGNVKTTDPLGTSIGSYGAAFARKVGSTNVAGPSPEANLPDLAAQGEQRAKDLFPDDPHRQETYMEQFLSHVQRNSTLMRTQLNQTIKQNRMNIDSVLFNVGSGDRGPTSLEEAQRINPNFQQLWEDASKLNPTITKHINDTFNYNAKQDVPMDQARFDRWQAAKGLAVTNPDEFLKLSPAALDLPRAQYNQIHTQQLSMAKKLQDNSHLNGLLRAVQPMINDAGIYANNPGQYNQFVGAFQSKVDDFTNEHKKPPTVSEAQGMAAGLIRDRGGWFGLGTSRDFEVPSDFMTDANRDKFKKQMGHDPTPAEIFKLYQLSKTP